MCDKESVCRTCLATDNLSPIFSRSEYRERYTVALFLTTGLQVECNDGLPQTICWDCTELVNTTLQFRNRCHRIELKLLQLGHRRRTPTERKKHNRTDNLSNFKINLLKPPDPKLDFVKQSHSKLKKSDLSESKFKNSDLLDFKFKKSDPSDSKLNKSNLIDCKLKESHSINSKLIKSDLTSSKLKKPDSSDSDFIKSDLTKSKLKNSDLFPSIKIENVYSCKEEILTKCIEEDKRTECLKQEFVDTNIGSKLYDAFKRRYSDDESNLSPGYASDQNHIVKSSVPRRKVKQAPKKCLYSNKEKRDQLMSLVEGPFHPEGPIQCRICKKSVARWSSFRSHSKLHLGFDFVCEYCGKSFISITQLRRHKSSKHGEARTLSCAHCSYKALDKPQLILHERREHTGERPYVCDTCAASYHSRRCLIQHIENHNTTRTIQCDQCPSMFKSRRHLARHTYGCHASAAYCYRCHVCRQVYKKLKYVRRHMLKMHGLTVVQQGTIDRVKL